MKLKQTEAVNSYRYLWLLKKVFPYIKPCMSRIIIGFMVAIPLGLLDGVVAFSLKPYMDYVIGQKDLVFTFLSNTYTIPFGLLATVIPFGVIGFALFQGVLRYLNDYISEWTSQKITNSVKKALFRTLVSMDTAFFNENSSGIVLSRFLTDPDTASRGIVQNIKTIITSSCGALGLICVMLHSSWKLALIGVVVLCGAFVPVAIIRKRVKQASNKNLVIAGDITTNMNETYAGNKVMTAYCLQKHQQKAFDEQIERSFAVTMSLIKRAGWMSPIMYLIASCGIATVLWYGTGLIIKGEMTAGGFASFVTSLLLLYKPVKTLGHTMTHIQQIFVALGRVFEIFDIKPELQEKPDAIELTDVNHLIGFNNISFGYDSERLILKNINLQVKKGETIALVGNSGGGKSTFVNLIPRFYDVNSGSITIDGRNIKDYTFDSLRKNIAMVFQDNFLFTGTIRENIMMGNFEASEEDLERAIESAHLSEMLSELPNGLDTEIGERGTTLSGGQRQRVAIARAMVRKSPIVILDEATSALDNKSEAIVQKALDNLMENKTVFVIAHRLSTIKNADRIAVINEGELVELGTHDELMSIAGGQYKALYDMQFKRQEVEV